MWLHFSIAPFANLFLGWNDCLIFRAICCIVVVVVAVVVVAVAATAVAVVAAAAAAAAAAATAATAATAADDALRVLFGFQRLFFLRSLV